MARLLEYKYPRDAVKNRIDSDDKVYYKTIDGARRSSGDHIHPRTIFVRTPAMLEFLVVSRMPKSELVVDWVCTSVLPNVHRRFDVLPSIEDFTIAQAMTSKQRISVAATAANTINTTNDTNPSQPEKNG